MQFEGAADGRIFRNWDLAENYRISRPITAVRSQRRRPSLRCSDAVRRRAGACRAWRIACRSLHVAVSRRSDARPARTAVDESPPPILQWFESSYQTIEQRIADVFMAGYGFVWLPPPFRADQGDFSVGYDVYDRFDLGRPGSPTLYGTEDGLKTLARDAAPRRRSSLHVDFVLNHNGFSNLRHAGLQARPAAIPGFVARRCRTTSTATSTPPSPAATSASGSPA